jgi:aldehyde:ferredoxin oxidoreductase
VLQYALYGKAGQGFIEDVRHTAGWAVLMATASRGGDYLKGFGTLEKFNRPDVSEYYFGRPDVAQPLTTFLKGASVAMAETRCALTNSLGLCNFLLAPDPVTFPDELFVNALHATTGVEFSAEELRLAAERTVNLEKAFNSRLGLRRGDDIICERWMKEPVVHGPGEGWKAEDYIEELKGEYYEWRGWNKESSLQTRSKLKELDMGDVAKVLAKENALA